ncbi:class I adenylate-forming enzyme family protein [Saccharomonospora glauca]|uniref:Acyl-CoA synthetase (AMP-forming)/AMP-acid ligase II n=1 Tax=Saccharomonospora glauca K62 TaxID=928724 RepID=I1CYP3_9PSEU|nr:fatty acid--CoA ligase family protein [Saccharomonospora glauca]EIE97817.1 acyl-CoA synthetase (AMP-forming)/AMP-acid ligase II [Saccharomonospora glauca K62]
MTETGTARFGPLWVDGVRVAETELTSLAAVIHRGLRGLPSGSVVQLPAEPPVGLVARTVVGELDLVHVLGEDTLAYAGMDAAALIDADGVVHRRAPGLRPRRLPGTARLAATSGSTGHPEAVAHGREAITFQASALQERLRFEAGEVMLLPLQTAHAYGASVVELWSRYGVGLMLEHTSPLRTFIPRLVEHKPSSVDLVPSMLAMLLSAARRDDAVAAGIDRLRLLNVGGDVLPPSLVEAARAVCDQRLLDGYGLTEAGPNVAVNCPEFYREGTVGRPLPGVRVRIDDGQIMVSSPSVLLGYVRDGNVVPQTDADGWLATGDLGSVDDQGYLKVVGRRKEVIIVHGRTFAPIAVEDALRAVPGVDDAGVVAVREEHATRDRVHAFVRAESNGTDADELRRRCVEALPSGLGPVRLRFVDELPLLPSGKLDRNALREVVRACT